MPQSQRTKARKFEANSRRARVARMQAEARRREQRRKLILVVASVFVVVAVIGTLVAVKLAGSTKAKGTGEALASASVAAAITHVPTSALNKAGAGPANFIVKPSRIVNQPPLRSGGKPEIYYNGAEYCPYCAAERWSLVIALSRFGTFHNLHVTSSYTKDVYPNTPTFSFYRTQYSSPYFHFTGLEDYTNKVCGFNWCPLQKMNSQQAAIFEKYSVKPFTNSTQAGYPFIDFAGKYLVNGPSYSPLLLHRGTDANKSPALPMNTILAYLTQPTSTVGSVVDATANWLTAAICEVDGGQPGSVCASPVIAHLRHTLATEKPVG